MAGGGGTPGSAGTIELNVVPLVDVACLLIMFFILTSQFASANFAEMQLATPLKSLSQMVPPKGYRVVVNVVCKSDLRDKNDTEAAMMASLQAKGYSIMGTVISVDDDYKELMKKKIATEMRKAWAEKAVDFTVEVRADKRVAYSTVEPVMTAAVMAIGEAKIEVKKMPVKMDLTAMMGSGG